MATLTLTPEHLTRALPRAAIAFRGYNVTNLGSSRELLATPAYAATIERHLTELGAAAAEVLKRPVDLVARVREGRESVLETYGEDIALILAMELAQLELLHDHFGIDYRQVAYSYGYSLGEIAALIAGGLLTAADALRIPLSLADDCVALARESTLAILFTRSSELPFQGVRRACLMVNEAGKGAIGISTYLAPNSVLLMGQGDTLDRFAEVARHEIQVKFHLRKNEHRWPPLHTPIMWERHIPDQAARLMHTMPLRLAEPKPNVLSLVSGHFTYLDTTARRMLREWIDHPQLLWNAVEHTLTDGIKTLIHVGPAPNLIPATFHRLAENVVDQLKESVGLRALSAAAHRRWLQRMLPDRASLLRAPYIEHVILEDWLLEHAPK